MKQLRESIATLLHHYYYGPEYYDVGPADIKVSRRESESMKNYQGMSDRKLIGLAERLVEDYDPDDPEAIYDIGTKPKDDGQGVIPTSGGPASLQSWRSIVIGTIICSIAIGLILQGSRRLRLCPPLE
jgi:hypothetical protein